MKRILLALLLQVSVFVSLAQSDTEFWFAVPNVPVNQEIFMNVSATDKPLNFMLSFQQGRNKIAGNQIWARGTIAWQIGESWTMVGRDSVVNFYPDDNVRKKGVYIQSSELAQASISVENTTNGDTWTMKGRKALGKTFFIPSQNIFANQGTARESFVVVATEDNTTVTIKPTVAVNNGTHLANIPYTKTLNKGETYCVSDDSPDALSSLGGSRVDADKPVAITIADDGLILGDRTDMIGDQILPVENLGTNYVVVKGNSNTERIFVVTTSPTTITQDGIPTTYSAEGTLVELQFAGSTSIITSSSPIYVYHITGQGNELASALVPDLCAGSRMVTVHLLARYASMTFMLVTMTSNTNSFVVKDRDGNVKTFTPTWKTASNPMISYCTVDLHNDFGYDNNGRTYMIENTAGYFQLGTLKNFESSSLYSYTSEISLISLTPDQTICEGSSTTLTAVTSFDQAVLKWYKDDVLAQTGGYTLNVNSAGTYKVTLPAMSYCGEESAKSVVTVVAPGNLVIHPKDTAICKKDTVVLSATTNYSTNELSWYRNNQLVQTGGTSYKATSEGTYKVTGTRGSTCSQVESQSTVKLKETCEPIEATFHDTTICQGQSIKLGVTTTGTFAGWYTTKGQQVSPTDQQPTVRPLVSTTYVVAAVLQGKTYTDTVTVTVKDAPVPNLGADREINCSGNTVITLSPGTFDTYLWSTGASTASITADTAGLYTVTVTKDGCPKADTITIICSTDPLAFPCDGSFFVSVMTGWYNTKLSKITISTGNSAVFSPVGPVASNGYDAIAFNPKDHYIYAYSIMTDHAIIRIKADGSIEKVGNPVLFPQYFRPYMADFDKNGNMVCVSSTLNTTPNGDSPWDGIAYVVNVSGATPTVIDSFMINGIKGNSVGDIAIHPVTGDIYFFSTIQQKLLKTDSDGNNMQVISSQKSSFLEYNESLWFDSYGNLWAYGSENGERPNEGKTLFKIHPTTGQDEKISTDKTIGIKNDGCSCPYFIDMFMTADKDSVDELAIFQYHFTINNSTDKAQTGVFLVDTLPEGISHYSMPTTIMGATPVVTQVGNRHIISLHNATIPVGTTRFVISAQAKCVSSTTTTVNRAYMPYLSPYVGGPVVSDDSTTTDLNDPSVVVVINKNMIKASVVASPVCEGSTFTLSVSTGLSDSTVWSGPGDFSSYNKTEQLTAQASMSGEYSCINYLGWCPDTARVSVVVTTMTKPDLGPDKLITCHASPGLTLAPGTFDTYMWNTGSTDMSITTDTAGLYMVTVTKDGCSKSDSMMVSCNTAPLSFPCDGSFYTSSIQSSNGSSWNQTILSRIQAGGNNATFLNTVGTPSTIAHEALGFNMKDHYLYAFGLFENGGQLYQFVRIKSDGSVEKLGTIPELPFGYQGYMADFDKNGNMIIASSLNSSIPETWSDSAYVVNVMGAQPTFVRGFTIDGLKTEQSDDLAINPTTGDIYYFSHSTRQFYKTDPDGKNRVQIGNNVQISLIAGLWFDASGNLWGYGSKDGHIDHPQLYKINATTGTSVMMRDDLPALLRGDGCSCPYYVDMFMRATSSTVNENSTVTYSVSIVNNTLKTQTGIYLVDTLPPGITITQPPATMAGVSPVITKVGDRQVLALNNITLPTGLTHFFINATSRCVNQNTTTRNSAYLPYLSPDIGGPVASDDSLTDDLNDPAIVTIKNASITSATVDKPQVCTRQHFVLHGTSQKGSTVQWTGPGGFSTTDSIATILASSTSLAGTYTFVANSTSGTCADTARVNVTINDAPVVELGPNQQIICVSTRGLTLSAGTYDSYRWSTGETTQSIVIHDPNEYRVSVSKNGCTSYDSISITCSKDSLKFECDGSFYVSMNSGYPINRTVLTQAKINAKDELNISNVGDTLQVRYDAIAFNSRDLYIYGWNLTDSVLVRVMSDGSIKNIGRPTGIPANFVTRMADFNADGYLVLAVELRCDGPCSMPDNTNPWDGTMLVVDVSKPVPTIVKTFKVGGINNIYTEDIAINPLNGDMYFYGHKWQSGYLYKCDKDGNNLTAIGPENKDIHHLDALWFDSNGSLWGFGDPPYWPSPTSYYKIDPATGLTKTILNNEHVIYSDGCSCPYYVDMYMTADNKKPDVGDTITYTISINNNSSHEQKDVYFVDTLPRGFEIVSAPQAILGSNTRIDTLANGTLVLVAEKTTLPHGFSRFELKARVGCTSSKGTVSNQAFLPFVQRAVGGPVASDDTTTKAINDPTVVAVQKDSMMKAEADKTTMCEGEAFTLTGRASVKTTEWKGPDSTWIASTVHRVANLDMAGIYTFSARKGWCVDTLQIRIAVKPKPRPNLGSDVSIDCNTGNHIIQPGTFDSYTWSTGATTASIPVNGAGTYIVTVSHNGCQNTDTINISCSNKEVPFVCDGNFYVSNTSRVRNATLLTNISVTNGNNVLFTNMGDTVNTEYDAIGYNPVDNYLYGYSRQKEQIVRISSNGSVKLLGRPTGFPDKFNPYMGDFDASGNFVVAGGTKYNNPGGYPWLGNGYVINVSGSTASLTSSFTIKGLDTALAGDIAIHPGTGDIYFFNNNNKKLYRTQSNGTNLIEISKQKSSNIITVESLWFDTRGNLWAYGDDLSGSTIQNVLFTINATNGADKIVYQGGPSGASNDGCSCPYTIDLFLIASKKTTTEGDTIAYQCTIANYTRTSQQNVSLVDTLPAGMTYVGTNPAGINVTVSTLANGRQVISIASLDLAVGNTYFELRAKAGCIATDSARVSNSAHLIKLPEWLGTVVASDDTTTQATDDASVVIVKNVKINAHASDTTVCAGDSITLEGQGPARTSFAWNHNAINNKRFIPATTTIYTLSATDINGCLNTDSVAVVIKRPPSISLGKDTSLCFTDKQTLVLVVDTGGSTTLVWHDGTKLDTFTVTKAGTVWVEATKAGCSTRDSIIINEKCNTVLSPGVIGYNKKVCKGHLPDSLVEITPASPVSNTVYRWESSIDSLKWDPVQGAHSRGYQPDSIARITWFRRVATDTISGHDTTTNAVKFTFQNTPAPGVSNVRMCKDSAAVALAATGTDLRWYSSLTILTPLQGAPVPSTLHDTTMVYYVTQTMNGCESIRDSILVTIDSLPHVSIIVYDTSGTRNNDSIICAGSRTRLTSSGATSYRWWNGSTSDSLSVTSQGTYTVTGTDSRGCRNTASVLVTVHNRPNPTITRNTTSNEICSGDSLVLDAGQYSSYQWSDSSSKKTTVYGRTPGTFTPSVTVTDMNGCTAWTSTAITVKTKPEVDLGTDRSFCKGSAVTIKLTNPMDSSLWNTGATTDSITVSTTGNYWVTVFNKGCSNSDTLHVEFTASITIDLGNDTSVCQGDSVKLSPGTGYDTYAWNTKNIGSFVFAKTPGTYRVTATSGNCSSTDSVIVRVNNLPTVSISSTDTDNNLCPGDSLVLDAGLFTSYLWNNKSKKQVLTVKNAGTYTVTVTDANTCRNIDSVNIGLNTIARPRILSSAAGKKICAGQTITLDAGVYSSYSWSNARSTQRIDIKPVKDTTFWVKVSSTNGCSSHDTIHITDVNPLPNISATASDDTICKGFTTRVKGHGSAITFVWDTVNMTDTTFVIIDDSSFIPRETYTYTVKGYDQNGCYDTAKVNIHITNPPTLSLSASSDSVCFGDSVRLEASGASKIEWNDSPLALFYAHPPSTTTYFVSGYNGTSNSCATTDSITIVVRKQPAVQLLANNDSLCYGDTLRLRASGNATSYVWRNNLGTDSTIITTPQKTTRYHVVSTLHGCSRSDSLLVFVHQPMALSIVADTVLCEGDSSVLSTTSQHPISRFVWSTADTGNSITVFPRTSTTYRVRGYTQGCPAIDSIFIRVAPLPSLVATVSDTVVCANSSVTFSASGAHSYSWNNGISNNSSAVVSTTTTYSVTGTSSEGCLSDTSIVVKVTKPTVSLSPTTICKGTSTTLTATGDADSFQWGDTTVTGNTITVSPFVTTIYHVTASKNNCSVTDSTTVTVLDSILVTITGLHPVCKGDSITLTVTGNASNYFWDNETTASTTRTYVPNQRTTITIKGSSSGCSTTTTDTIEVNLPPVVIASASRNSLCKGDALTLSGTGASTYTWSDSVINNQPFTPTHSKKFRVTGTDNNGCVASDSISITVNLLPVVKVTATRSSICEGEKIKCILPPGLTYSWDKGSNFPEEISPGSTKRYIITGTDANNCSDTTSINIIVNPRPQVSANPVPPVCLGDYVTLSASGTGTFEWSNDVPNGTPFKPLVSQRFIVTCTDANRCSDTASTFVLINTAGDVSSLTSIDKQKCSGDSIMAVTDDTQPFSYVWSDGLKSNKAFVPSMSTTFTVTITNLANGCSEQISHLFRILPRPPAPGVTPLTTICSYSPSPVLTATGYQLKWFLPTDTNKVIGYDSILTTNIWKAGTYTWLVKQTSIDGCTGPAATMRVTKLPKTSEFKIHTTDSTMCEFPKRKGTYAAVGYTGKITWKTPVGIAWTTAKLDSSVIDVQWKGQGVNTLIVTNTSATGCIDTASQVVSLAPYPRAQFEESRIYDETSLYLDNTSDSSVIDVVRRKLGNTYRWNFGRPHDAAIPYNGKDTVVEFPYGAHTINLWATNAFGCVDSTSKDIFIDITAALYVPNAFTPGSGNDDLQHFRPKGYNLEKYQVWIYDTWGNLLWYSDKLIDGQPFEGWDGMYEGVSMKGDSYIWKIEAEFKNNEKWKGSPRKNGKKKRIGSVLLIR